MKDYSEHFIEKISHYHVCDKCRDEYIKKSSWIDEFYSCLGDSFCKKHGVSSFSIQKLIYGIACKRCAIEHNRCQMCREVIKDEADE